MLSHWECYALAVAGVLGFVLQQVSLGTGRLAPSVATVSVANPVVGILIGVILLDERLSRPAWHVLVAVVGLGLALVGAVVISLAREATRPEPPPGRRAGRESRWRCRTARRRTAWGWSRRGARVIYAGAEVLFYALAAAASALVLAATFVVIRSERPRTNGIAFLSGFVFGTLIACGLGLALGQAAVSRFDSHETFKAVATVGLGLALLAVGLQIPADEPAEPEVRSSRAAAIIGGLRNVGPAASFSMAGLLGFGGPKRLVLTFLAMASVTEAGAPRRRRHSPGRGLRRRVHHARLGAGRHRGHRGRARRT